MREGAEPDSPTIFCTHLIPMNTYYSFLGEAALGLHVFNHLLARKRIRLQ